MTLIPGKHARQFDETYKVSQTASATATAATEQMQKLDEQYKLRENATSAAKATGKAAGAALGQVWGGISGFVGGGASMADMAETARAPPKDVKEPTFAPPSAKS